MILLLFKYRFKMFLSVFRGGKGFGKAMLFLVAALLLAFSIASMSFAIYRYAVLNPASGEAILNNLTAISFHGMFLFLLFWGLSMAIFTIFFSSDLELLLTLPFRSGDLFIYKVLEATLLNARLSFLFLIPFLLILGIYFHAYIYYYLIVLVVVLLLAVIPGALGIIIAAALCRKIPRARLKGAITVVGSFIGVGIWALINKISGRFDSQAAGLDSSGASALSLLSSPLFQWLPSGWAYNATSAAARGDFLASLIPLAIMAAVSAALTFAALKLTAHYYADGIAEEVGTPISVSAARFELGGSPLMAHIKRDLIILSREPGVITQSLVMILFLLLYPFVAHQGTLEELAGVPISPVSAMLAAFFGGQVGFRLIPTERLGFWRNLVFPNSRRLVLMSKLSIGLMLTTVFVMLISAIHYAAGRYSGVAPLFLTVFFTWSGLAIGVPTGLFWGRFSWDNPRNMLTSGGGFFYALFTIGVSVVLYLGLFFADKFLGDLVNPILLAMVFSLGMLLISIVISALRLENMEWNPDV